MVLRDSVDCELMENCCSAPVPDGSSRFLVELAPLLVLKGLDDLDWAAVVVFARKPLLLFTSSRALLVLPVFCSWG